MTLVVTLTIAPDRLDAFREFESKASEIMSRYGGRIERAVFVPPTSHDAAARELHIVTFPDAASFDAYRSDPRYLALAELRASAILSTDVLIGEDRGGEA